MDTATQTHLTTLRNLLAYRRHELQTEIRAAEMARRRSAGAGAAVFDRKDEAADASAEEVVDAEERRDLGELAEVEAALRRLDSGTYGDCGACGEPIPLQRLLAQPAALRCVRCQTEFEHHP